MRQQRFHAEGCKSNNGQDHIDDNTQPLQVAQVFLLDAGIISPPSCIQM
jgi:hypothetical protein